MAVRPRRKRRSSAPWSPAIALALQIGPAPQLPGDVPRPSDEALEAAWKAYGPYLLADVKDPASLWAWRRFSGDGAERPRLYPTPQLPALRFPDPPPKETADAQATH